MPALHTPEAPSSLVAARMVTSRRALEAMPDCHAIADDMVSRAWCHIWRHAEVGIWLPHLPSGFQEDQEGAIEDLLDL